MSTFRGLFVLALFGGCDDPQVSDIDDNTDELEPPDLRGDYDATFEDPEGCDSEPVAVDWATGPLTISGAVGAPDFAFGELVVTGFVEASFNFGFEGTVTGETQDLLLVAEGVAFEDDGLWTLDGDLSVSPVDGDGAPSCTLAGAFKALQVTE